ncbi:MAG TPA: hypothetical protein VFB59_00720 [Candidatus Saccharimonadales bacterium]|nr:hypothetical protein [Candidatus Saccharimonadales bacterium]
MKFNALNCSTETRIFPIPFSVVRHYFEQFSGFDEEQITLITGSNQEITVETDPTHHLLRLVECPDLVKKPDSAEARAYRAGVCIGTTIIRSRMAHLLGRGALLHLLKVKPDKRYLDGPDPLAQIYFQTAFVDKTTVTGALRLTESLTYGLYTHDDVDDEKLFIPSPLARLEDAWHEKMSFMVGGTHLDETDNIGLGISHTFRLYSFLEDRALKQVPMPAVNV